MIIFKRILIFLGVVLYTCTMNVWGQDIQFSQFYAASTYLNPAFAGSAHNSRAIFHQRVQWPSIDARYLTTFFSFDTYSCKYKSGFGIYALRDIQGKNILATNEVALQYSYEVGLSSKLAFRPGLQVGFINRSLDYTHLYYPDQYTANGLQGPTQDPNYNTNHKTFLDIGAGGIIYTEEFWFSYSGQHLTSPNQSFWGDTSILPVKHSYTTGYRIAIKKKETKEHIGHSTNSLYIVPTAHYKFQGKSDQVDFGMYVLYNDLIAGLWYRGIPFKKFLRNLQNNESMIALLGWKFDNFRISYSYDFVVSKLRVTRTGGAHELNLTYLFGSKKKTRHLKVLPCPK